MTFIPQIDASGKLIIEYDRNWQKYQIVKEPIKPLAFNINLPLEQPVQQPYYQTYNLCWVGWGCAVDPTITGCNEI